MLEDLFSKFNKKYHVSMTNEGKRIIADDCPPDLFEELRESDTRFFREEGHHLFANFEIERQND